MKSYQAYLFDWDGTLAETQEMWLRIMRVIYQRYGYDLADDDLVDCLGRVGPHALEHGLDHKKLDKFMADVKELSAIELPHAVLYPDVTEMLELLKNAGHTLALITTNWRSNIKFMLRQHSLEQTFDIIIAGDDVAYHKPDPEGILTVIKKLKITKSKSVMLGDSPHDLEAAANAGIDSILFYPPSHQLFYKLSDLKTYRPTAIIDGWNKLRP